MTLSRLLLLLAVFWAAPLRAEEARAFIKWGWCCSIFGHATWTVWSDDIMEYEGQYQGAKPDMPGWKWKDRAHEYGVARFRNAGAYERARAVADAALKDPVLKKGPPPPGDDLCSDGGTEQFWLTGNKVPDFADSGGCNPNRYRNRIVKLTEDLEKAIEADQVMPHP